MSLLFTVLNQLPIHIHDDVKEILNAMLTSKNIIGWDSKLRLIIDDRVLPRTNIANLVAHVLYPHDERIKYPRGFNVFVQGLKDIGLESEWVENEIAKSVLESMEDDTGETSDSELDDDDDDEINIDDDDDEELDENDASNNKDKSGNDEADIDDDDETSIDDDDDDGNEYGDDEDNEMDS